MGVDVQVESLDSISEVDMVGTAPGWLQGGITLLRPREPLGCGLWLGSRRWPDPVLEVDQGTATSRAGLLFALVKVAGD